MSVAIRKRSWEEHVTQKTGQPFNSDECDIACHHGLVADSLQASMEKDASLNVDHKEKCASLPDCCHVSEPRDFPGRPMGQISKEVDESDSQEGEEQFLSLEASTETLVHISDEDTDSDVYLTNDTRIITPQRHERDSHHSVEGAGSFIKTLPVTESNQDNLNSWGMTGEVIVSPAEKSRERKDVDAINKSLEICNDRSLSEVRDVPKVNIFDSWDVKDLAPEKQLLNSAVIAQQRRKPDFPKGEQERNSSHVGQDESLTAPCADEGLPLLEADCGSHLPQPPSCPSGKSAENDLEKNGFSEHENKSPPEVNTEDGMQCLHLKDPVTTQEPTDSQVRLRKKKEIREDRDRARLDSMVLLIMKLDQLDQDIENALSTASSPSSTPTNLRRQVPDLESGSESGAHIISIIQAQANLTSHTEFTALPSSTLVTDSGTKPKATAVPGISEKENAGVWLAVQSLQRGELFSNT
ncbi:rho GTPase-activating protein 7 isoform X4 [Nannospalax galili]|uniref:rho GTPase-activating protein 7 isoform X4 n=1 Tax=Nannospalax galili TaxID=1026970 RepID=UPI00111BD957|nr:rho GTPase-activating protein 7 isoform X4 [Nannospalax galili]